MSKHEYTVTVEVADHVRQDHQALADAVVYQTQADGETYGVQVTVRQVETGGSPVLLEETPDGTQ